MRQFKSKISVFVILLSISCLTLAQPVKADIFSGLEIDSDLPATTTPESIATLTSDLTASPESEGAEAYEIVDPADAQELARLYLDAATITKGYTVKSLAEDFKAGVVDNAVTVPVTVVLKKIPAWHMPVAKTGEKISYIFDYDIRQQLGDVTESLGVLEKPIYVALKYESDSLYKKVVHFWNRPTQAWLPLPSTTDFDNKLARAVIHLPYARLAVFDEPQVYEGLASWYAYKNCHCTAATLFPKQAVLRVTNVTSASRKYGEWLDVRVNDYGPDPLIHPDRVIDLDKLAYTFLADSLGSGVMHVKVERLE